VTSPLCFHGSMQAAKLEQAVRFSLAHDAAKQPRLACGE
jgi:hypothetical protein